MNEIEQIDNYVKIGDRMIPAGNIQVDGYPGWKTNPKDGLEYWYGIYFEIAFEDGSLWTVDQWSEASFSLADEDKQKICVAEYARFGMDRSTDMVDYAWLVEDWDDFVNLYKAKLEGIKTKSIVGWDHYLTERGM